MSKSVWRMTEGKLKDWISSLFADIIKVLIALAAIGFLLFLVWFFFDR